MLFKFTHSIFPNSCSIPFNEIWLMFIAYTQPNTKSGSLVQLHPFKDLILSSQIKSNSLNPKDLQLKSILQDLKGRIFHQTPKFLCRSSCLQKLSYFSFPKISWGVIASIRTAVQKGSSCPFPSWPVTRKGWAQSCLEHEQNFKSFPSL